MSHNTEAHSSGLDTFILDAIIENSTASIAYLDANFKFIKVNSPYVKGSGFSKEELLGKDHFALFPNAENEAIFRKAVETGEPIEFKEKAFVFESQPERGTTYWDWKLTPVKDDAGKVFGLILSLFDMTDMVRARKSLEESEQKIAEQNKILEEKVAERTVALERTIKEQELLMESFVGRELTLIDLKKKLGEQEGK